MALTPKKRLFAAEYQVDQNATQAAIRAGYSARSAAVTGHKLLQESEVQSLIASATKARFERISIDADFVLQGLARIARANATDFMRIDEKTGRAYIDFSNATPEMLEAISSVEEEEFVERTGPGRDDFEAVRRIRFKLHDKAGAYIALGRHLKLFTDRAEVDATVNEATDARSKLAARLSRRTAQSA